jgi:hypothetical protein
MIPLKFKILKKHSFMLCSYDNLHLGSSRMLKETKTSRIFGDPSLKYDTQNNKLL